MSDFETDYGHLFEKVDCDKIAGITKSIAEMIDAAPYECVMRVLDDGGASLTMTFAREVETDTHVDESIYSANVPEEASYEYSYVEEALGRDPSNHEDESFDESQHVTQSTVTTLYSIHAKGASPLAAASEIVRQVHKQKMQVEFSNNLKPGGAFH